MTQQIVWILIRYIMGEEKKTHDEVVEMLLKEALTARGMLKPMTEEKTDGTV